MPEATLNEVLVRQYGRSWRMLEEAVRCLSPEAWKASDVDYLTPARSAYHIVEAVEFYSGDTPAGFDWGHRFGCDWEGGAIEQLPSQKELLAYLAEVRTASDAWLRRIDPAGSDVAFPGQGGTFLDRALYVLRHNHHHIGEMWSEIKRRGHPLPDWW